MQPLRRVVVAAAALACLAPTAQASSPGANGTIAFVANASSDLLFNHVRLVSDIAAAPPTGGAVALLSRTGPKLLEADPAWSPQGDRLAFSRARRGKPRNIFVANADGSGLTRLTFRLPGASSPTWSPDGSRIAFVRAGDIWVMNADGSDEQPIAVTDAVEARPRWSPGGGAIAFIDVSDPEQATLWTMGEDGADRRQLTPPATTDENADWSPDGSRLVVERRTFDERAGGDGFGLVTVAADGSDERRIFDATYHAGVGDPSWSPDGQQIAFTAGIFGYCWIETVPLGADGLPSGAGGEVAGDLFDGGLYCHSSPAWQPLPAP